MQNHVDTIPKRVRNRAAMMVTMSSKGFDEGMG